MDVNREEKLLRIFKKNCWGWGSGRGGGGGGHRVVGSGM